MAGTAPIFSAPTAGRAAKVPHTVAGGIPPPRRRPLTADFSPVTAAAGPLVRIA